MENVHKSDVKSVIKLIYNTLLNIEEGHKNNNRNRGIKYSVI